MLQVLRFLNPVSRMACGLLAALCLVLAIVGVVLPLLPTTPFVLLANYLLIRASPRLHSRLQAILKRRLSRQRDAA